MLTSILYDANKKLSECAHTRILGQLLQNPEICDNFFSSMAGLQTIKPTNPIVEIEKYSVDLTIRDEKSVIIVENKVMNAHDQRAQLGRYVKAKLDYFDNNKVFVLYLTKDDAKQPSEQTWIIDGINYKDQIGDFVQLTYKDNIIPWLEHLYETIEEKQVYLRSYILQYLSFLEFRISPFRLFEKLLREKYGVEPYTNDSDYPKVGLRLKWHNTENVYAVIETSTVDNTIYYGLYACKPELQPEIKEGVSNLPIFEGFTKKEEWFYYSKFTDKERAFDELTSLIDSLTKDYGFSIAK